jgi:hypothetical protein
MATGDHPKSGSPACIVLVRGDRMLIIVAAAGIVVGLTAFTY